MSEHIIWNEIGTLYFNTGAYAQATKAYQRAIELGGDFSAAMQNLALTYVQEGELAKAVPIYKKALELIPQDKDKADIWHQLGDIYSQLQDRENALRAYKMAAEIAPDYQQFVEDFARAGNAIEKEPPSENDGASPAPVSALDDWHVVDPKTAETAETFIAGTTDKLRNEGDEPVAGNDDPPMDEIPAARVDEESAPVVSADSRPVADGLFQINIEQIYANPAQPRLRVDVQQLVESIREYGIIQPLIVTPGDQPGRYILVSGERRLEAARQVGLDTVPAIVREIDEQQRLELALIENVQRQNLSLLEQADAYAQLKSEFGLSPDQIAKRMGKSSVAVTNLLRLLKLPEKVRRALDAGRIDEEHARALFLLPDEKTQKEVLQRILDEDLSVRKTEALVRELLIQVIEENDQPEPEADEPVLERVPETQVVEADTAVLAKDIDDVTIAAASDDAPIATPPDDEGLEDELAEDFIPGQETVVAAEDQQEMEAAPAKEDAPQPVAEGVQEDAADTLPIPSLPQTVNFDDPQQHLTDEQVRNRIATFKRVTEVNPNNDKAWGKLGNHYAHLGEDENAIEAYLRAIDLAPNIDDYHYQLGQVYISQRRFEDAAKELEQVVVLNEKNVFAHCALASCYRHLEMDDKAQEHIEIVAPVMEYEKAYNQACFEAIRGNVIRSIELLRTALRLEQTTIEQIRCDSDFDFIREEAVFNELMSESVSVGQ
ncbi:MAG: ParB/RepB/Spo0J family partition protein [Chloroflexi bacterium]|nr:ParB/RepB/Spo0J family partition protein [Chloroflexota bacterium]